MTLLIRRERRRSTWAKLRRFVLPLLALGAVFALLALAWAHGGPVAQHQITVALPKTEVGG